MVLAIRLFWSLWFALAIHSSLLAVGPIKIPFRYVQSFIIVEVKIENFIPVKLIFDTGAEHTVLFERAYTDIFKDSYAREIKILGSDLKREIPALVTKPLDVHINPVFFIKHNLIALKEKEIFLDQIIGERVDGIMGAYLFKDYIIELNYKSKYITLHPRHKFHLPKGKYTSHDIHLYKNKPYIDASAVFSDSLISNLNLLLDTGAGVSLILYPNSNPSIHLPQKSIPGYLGSGIGGIIEGYVCKLPEFSFCDYHFPQTICNLQILDTDFSIQESLKKNGLIGNLILERFSVIFDYQQERMYLRPLKNFSKKSEYDKSGLYIITGGRNFSKFYVSQVLPGSPASDLGILEGDEIISVGRIPSSFLNLSYIQEKLQSTTGKIIPIHIKRGDKKIKFQLTLRDML